MKRSDVLDALFDIIHDDDIRAIDKHYRILSYVEDIGMLPPPCTVTIKDGKHTPTERVWDEENG